MYQCKKENEFFHQCVEEIGFCISVWRRLVFAPVCGGD